MKVSVALAACRGEKFIGEQLQSLFDQTRPPDEIVIGDDSPDGATYEVIRTFEARYPGVIRYLHNPKALGVNGNFASAMSRCSGEVIFLCDQDDVWRPGKIERMLMFFDNPAIGGVFCDSAFIDENGERIPGTLFEMRRFNPARKRRMLRDGALAVFARDVYASGHNMAFRAGYREILLPFPELPGIFEDSWIGLALAARSEWGFVDEPLTLYRRHDGNLSSAAADSLSSQIAASRAALQKGHLQGAVNAAEAALARLPDLPEEKRRRLEALLLHRKRRLEMGKSGILKRHAAAWRELINGGYFRYSGGIKSFMVDLVLRRRAKNGLFGSKRGADA